MPRALVLVVMLVASMVRPSMADLSGTASVTGKALPDAVVWLDAPNAPRRPHPAQAVLDQRNMQFFPHVLAVQIGTKIKFPNDDTVFHSVFSQHDGQQFNLGLYPVGVVRDFPFTTAGLSRVFCNIHPQMAAYIWTLDTPYFAVSDAAGRFTIHDVATGSYTYHAWRPGGTILTATIDVRGGATLDVRWP